MAQTQTKAISHTYSYALLRRKGNVMKKRQERKGNSLTLWRYICLNMNSASQRACPWAWPIVHERRVRTDDVEVENKAEFKLLMGKVKTTSTSHAALQAAKPAWHPGAWIPWWPDVTKAQTPVVLVTQSRDDAMLSQDTGEALDIPMHKTWCTQAQACPHTHRTLGLPH